MMLLKLLAYLVTITAVFAVSAGFYGLVLPPMWAWIVPDVFSGLVKAHLLPAHITFTQAWALGWVMTYFKVNSEGLHKAAAKLVGWRP